MGRAAGRETPVVPERHPPARRRLVCVLLGSLVGIPAPAHAMPATEELQRDQQAVVTARHASDWRGALQAALRLQAFVNGSPASYLEVARARHQLGDTAGALQAIGRFLALGQISPLLTTGMFPKLTPALAALAAANARAAPGGGSTGMTIAAGLPAEDIAHDTVTGRFLVSAVLGHGVVAIDAATHAVTPFAQAPDHWPMLALALDAKRRHVWATEVALAGFASVPKVEQGRSALLEYDLDRHSLLARIPGPAGADLGDMTLDATGAPIVSDGDGGGIYRLQDGTLRRIDHGDFVSPQTIAICEDGRVFVPDYVRGIAAFDLHTGAVRWLSAKDHALAGIDGLYCHDHALMATQNGTAPERVIRFQLDPMGTGVTAERIIARPPDGDFTHGVRVGAAFYFLASAGWTEIDDQGVRTGTLTAGPATILASPFADP